MKEKIDKIFEKIRLKTNKWIAEIYAWSNVVLSVCWGDNDKPDNKRLQPLIIGTILFLIVVSTIIAIATWLELKRQQHIEATFGDTVVQTIQKRELSLLGFSKSKMFARYKAALNIFEQDIYSKTQEIVADCKDTPVCHAVVIYKYINENFKITTGILVGEKKLKQPIETWIDREGCTEDIAVLYVSMLYGLGHELNITLTPREAYVMFANFKTDEFIEEIINRYKAQYGVLKAMKVELKPREKHHIKIEGDFRYYPLILDASSTGIFNIKFYQSADEYRRFREGITNFINKEYDRDAVQTYKKEIFMEKGGIIVFENVDATVATLSYSGYRSNDEETHRYIESLISIHKGDGSRYSCHASMVFSLEGNHLPGRETNYISDIRLADGTIEIPFNIISEKFLKQVKNPVK